MEKADRLSGQMKVQVVILAGRLYCLCKGSNGDYRTIGSWDSYLAMDKWIQSLLAYAAKNGF